MIPSEDKCQHCDYFTTWCGQYGMVCFPACSHPDSGPRAVNLLSVMDECPKEK